MSNSAEHMLDGWGRGTEDGVQIPEWLRQLDRESRQRQRRIIVRIDDDEEAPQQPAPAKRDSER